tara:strand:+ start:658 stop:1044 length:387 start_codon:yes stop_codon:yes gene_type:complete
MTYQSNTYSVSDTVSRATNVGTGITERENKMDNNNTVEEANRKELYDLLNKNTTNINLPMILADLNKVQSWIDEARGIYPETGGGNFLLNSASKRLEEIKEDTHTLIKAHRKLQSVSQATLVSRRTNA